MVRRGGRGLQTLSQTGTDGAGGERFPSARAFCVQAAASSAKRQSKQPWVGAIYTVPLFFFPSWLRKVAFCKRRTDEQWIGGPPHPY